LSDESALRNDAPHKAMGGAGLTYIAAVPAPVGTGLRLEKMTEQLVLLSSIRAQQNLN
jgi:hypothetical protein